MGERPLERLSPDMTPKPPSSSDGSPLSPRHRPVLGNLAHDTTEIDLWAFDDELEGPNAGLGGPRGDVEETKPANRDLPAPREKSSSSRGEEPKDPERSIVKTPTGGEERIRMNVNKPRVKNQPAGFTASQSSPDSDFEDLDNWEDIRLQPEPEMPVPPVIVAPEEEEELEDVEEIPNLQEELPAVAQSSPETVLSSDDEFSPVRPVNAVPISLRPHLKLTALERVGLGILLALLAVTAAFVLIASSKGIRTESVKASERDFPIQGEKVTIQSAVNYWRPPITEGPDADVFRRDTQLLPVVELDVRGGPAVIRVLFRNDERTIVGDAVNRTVQQSGLVKIAATAGFDDLGMHAAYRTGESKPWTIEVYEDAGGESFRLLFEMNISTDRR